MSKSRVSGRPEPEEGTMHPLFVELFIDTQEDVLAEDEERRMRRARRRRTRQVRVRPTVRPTARPPLPRS
jgi:hypothetical protein